MAERSGQPVGGALDVRSQFEKTLAVQAYAGAAHGQRSGHVPGGVENRRRGRGAAGKHVSDAPRKAVAAGVAQLSVKLLDVRHRVLALAVVLALAHDPVDLVGGQVRNQRLARRAEMDRQGAAHGGHDGKLVVGRNDVDHHARHATPAVQAHRLARLVPEILEKRVGDLPDVGSKSSREP